MTSMSNYSTDANEFTATPSQSAPGADSPAFATHSPFLSNLLNNNSSQPSNPSAFLVNETLLTNKTIITSMSDDDWDNWFGWNLVNVTSLTSLIASSAMVIGGVVPYVPQYIEIKRTRNSSGFSTYVCLALIAANTLRIIFWFGKKFETPLLIQSIVMIAAMFVMMEICLRMRKISSSTQSGSLRKGFHAQIKGKSRPNDLLSTDPEDDDVKEDDHCINNSRNHAAVVTFPSPSTTANTTAASNRRFNQKCFTDLNPRDFWQWTDLISYIECTSAFTVVVGLLMYLLMDSAWFVESLGYASLLTEACLAVPQLCQNYRSRSTIGMSASMVLLWAGGDLFKTGYFLIKQVPMQFIVCGIIQVSVDLLILAQVSIYSTTITMLTSGKKKEPPTTASSSSACPKDLKT